MVIEIFKEINAYLKLLAEDQNLYIFIHDLCGITLNYRNYITVMNQPLCEYCKLLLEKEDTIKHCYEKEYNVLVHCKNGEVFFGMCYAGVEGFVVPITCQGKVLGFISVGGYRNDEEKALSRIDYVCKEYGFSKEKMIDHYYRYLNPNPPTLEKIQGYVSVVARMLELAYNEIKNDTLNMRIVNRGNICSMIKDYIDIKYMVDVNVKILSDHLHCSPSYISNTFKKDSGKTIKGYLNSIRVEKAKVQLETTKSPIGTIAASVGFTDSNYFATIFKQIYGITPRQCRNSALL